MADRGGFLTEGVITYAYILLYIPLSSGQIFFNKWVLSSKEINFPYPLGLTASHGLLIRLVLPTHQSPQGLSLVGNVAFLIMKVEEGMTVDIYITSVIPVGAIFAMTLWLGMGNTAYLYISVAFAQMLKAIRTTGLAIWDVALLGILAGGALLVYNTGALSQ